MTNSRKGKSSRLEGLASLVGSGVTIGSASSSLAAILETRPVNMGMGRWTVKWCSALTETETSMEAPTSVGVDSFAMTETF